jgi:hypothetical protein
MEERLKVGQRETAVRLGKGDVNDIRHGDDQESEEKCGDQ